MKSGFRAAVRPAADPTALVADDDRAFAVALAEGLEARNMSTAVAHDADRFRELVQAVSPSLVVLEPNLPHCSWYGLLSQARGLAPQAQLVVVTAFGSEALVELATELGSAAVLAKPATAEQILACLPGGSASATGRADEENRPRSLGRVEWEYINRVIKSLDGNMLQAARLLQISRQTLYRKLRKHPPRF